MPAMSSRTYTFGEGGIEEEDEMDKEDEEPNVISPFKSGKASTSGIFGSTAAAPAPAPAPAPAAPAPAAAPAASGWGDLFKPKPGQWRVDVEAPNEKVEVEEAVDA